MINFEEELKKFSPNLEVDDFEMALHSQDVTDAIELLVKTMAEDKED